MYKKVVVAFILLLLLVLGGCTPAVTPETDEGDVPPVVQDESNNTERDNGPTSDGVVRADYVDDRDFGEIQFSEDNGVELVFWTEETVTDFQVLEIDLEDHENYSVKEIFAVDALTGENNLVVDIVFPAGFPTRGISYTFNGEKKYYSISYNGRGFGDPVLLVEFKMS